MSFVVYRSSAGSGKTFTLVLQYIRLLLEDPGRFRNILAITFTNKAAAEMKQRIVLGLAGLAAGKQDSLYDQLALQGFEPSLIRTRASIALRKILHEYDDLAVGTIDSFMHRVVRTFARDMHIPAGFEVQLDLGELSALVVDLLLDKVGNDDPVTRVMQDFMSFRIGEEGSARLDDELSDYVQILLKEEARERMDSLRSWNIEDYIQLAASLKARIRERNTRLQDLVRQALRCIESYGLTDQDVIRKTSGLLAYFRRLRKADWTNPMPSDTLMDILNKGVLAHPQAHPERRALAERATPELLSHAREVIAFLQHESSQQRDDLLIHRRIYLLALAGAIRQVLSELKDTRNILPISEFNALVASVVLSEPVPFIYERLGERYRHFFLDEFQDTSVLQWIDLVPLIENSLAGGHLSLIVGDGKQSIYRWRSGDVRQFLSLPDLDPLGRYPAMRDKESLFAQSYHEEVLQHNFRSSPEIIRFNNDFFGFARDILSEQWKHAYRDVAQESGSKSDPGRVEIRFVESKGSLERDRIFMDNVLEIVRLELSLNTPLRELAILCRTNREASLIASALIGNDIDVISTESVLLESSARVNALASLMEVVASPDDRLAATGLVRHLDLCGLNADQSVPAALEDLELFAGKTTSPRTMQWLEGRGISVDVSKVRRLPLYDLAEHLMRALGFGGLQDVYLQFFLETVDHYIRTFDGSLQGFLGWWKASGSKRSVVVPPGMDAVTILTIHKAKGLEFPVVIYPYFTARENVTHEEIWVDTDTERYSGLTIGYVPASKALVGTSWENRYYEENYMSALDIMNVHYVAFTRARQRLYIISSLPPEKPSESKLPRLGVIMRDFLMSKGLWNAAKFQYVIGNESIVQHSTDRTAVDKEKEECHDFSMHSFSWSHRLRLSRKSGLYWDDNPQDEAISQGLLAHRVMAEVRQQEDLGVALQREVMAGNLDEASAGELKEKILSVIRHPRLEAHFTGKGKVYNEAEILEPGGNTWRPDRVVEYQDRIVVIDYKTGIYLPEHEEQVREYARILQRMGYPRVEAILAYLGHGQVLGVEL